MKRFSDYDPFAWLYTTYWGEDFHQRIMPALDAAALGSLPTGAKVLDLCCGDGRLTQLLVKRGYQVTGLDGSQEMLTYAQQRCPAVPFLLADARDFSLRYRNHAVVSTFDSLNHVLRLSDLAKVFASVWEALRPGGVFLFDLNHENAYRELWSRTATTVEDDVVSVASGAYDEKKRLATCDVTLMKRELGVWQRYDFHLRQRFHPPADVLRSLTAASFEAEVFDSTELGMTGHYAFGRKIYRAWRRQRRLSASAHKGLHSGQTSSSR